jgi:cAMP phosphodiesterases class-II
MVQRINLDNNYHKISSTVSTRCMPLSHGKTTKQEDYPSLAYFIRHKVTGREFLFFGDVEPDSISGKGTTRAVWRAAAPLIASGSLNTIFLECSWLTGRPDPQLFGHLTPPYFVEELRSLASEVTAYRESGNANNNVELDSESQPLPKRRRSVQGYILPSSSLTGLKVYVIHCKEPTEDIKDTRHIAQITASEIRSLLKDDLGVEILAAEPGMRICE